MNARRNTPPQPANVRPPIPGANGPLGMMPAWLVTVLRPVALTILVGCVALPLTQILATVVPGLHRSLLLVAVGFAALEAHYTYHLIRKNYISGAGLWRVRLIEFGVYYVVLKLAQFALAGAPAAGWPHTATALLEYLFDLETLIMLPMAVAVALTISDTLEDLDRVGETPEADKNYVMPLDALTGRFFLGGILVVVLSGLARIGLQDLLNFERAPVTGLVATVLVYYVVGFVMLGQVRLGLLASTWEVQGARVPSELGTRWVRYSLAFLGLAGLIAFALPTGYTAGALGWIGSLVILLLNLITSLVTLLLGLIFLPLSWLMSLFNSNAGPPPAADAQPTAPPAQLITQIPPAWLELARTILVWALISGMALYVIINYLRDRPELLRAVRDFGPLRRLRQMWAALRHRVSGLAAAVQALPVAAWLRERLRARPGALPPLGYFRLGGATPREQVQYYYLSLLRRAGERGFGRQPAQTPAEYTPTLAANLPENTPEVQALTEAFVETRYSAHPVGDEQVQGVRAAWGRLRTALAKQRKLDSKERGQDG